MTTPSHGEMREIHPVTGDTYRYRTEDQGNLFTFHLEGDDEAGSNPKITLTIDSRLTGEGICQAGPGRSHQFAWAWAGTELHLWLDGILHVFQLSDSSTNQVRRRGGASTGGSGDILAPMPGAVLEVLVEEGDEVERNQTLVVMESMKMELLISSPRDGVVRRVSVQAGQLVERGMRLLELAPEGEP